MLVAGQENIEIQLLADPVCGVLARSRKRPAARQIPLKAAVIDAHREIDVAFQRRERTGRRRKWVFDRNAGQVFRPLPDVHVVGHNTDNADAKPVFERMYPRGEASGAIGPADILADASGMQRIKIAVQICHAVVEIVVPERHIVVSAAVHDLGKFLSASDRIVAIGSKRRTLQQISAVDDERVAVLLEPAGALEKAEIFFCLAAVVGGVDVAVKIGGKVNRQLSFLHRLTPEPA